ncbi:MAG: class I SAM-dependent methyltransferase [Acidimicrobiia bacterium]|nr:class I SAM-dependent methyltransferase [Acidimicrobiia bacterium]
MSQPGCRLCGAGTRSFYQVESVPTSSCILHLTREAALAQPVGTLDLAVCPACGFIQNQAFASGDVDYTLPYEDSQATSPTFVAFAERTARQLVQKHGLKGKQVLEVGCGKAEWLAIACRVGAMTGLGVDPAYEPGRAEAGDFTVLSEFLGPESDFTGDLIACRHTLEHVPNASEFAGWLRSSAIRTPGAVAFIEVPDTARILTEGAFWDVYYEHCSYFTATSLRNLARVVGFEVLDLYLDFADQYLLLEATPGEAGAPNADAAHVVELASSFNQRVDLAISTWRDRISATTQLGRPAVLWGASSKAVGFISSVAVDIAAAVDINKAKHGSYLSGSGTPVISPAQLPELSPGLVVVMNPVYVPEIADQLSVMGVDASVVAVGADLAGS